MTEQKRFIAVIGGSDCTPEESRLAEEVGRELARKGAILICGGLGGIMEAACKGASAEDGLTVGILPGGSRQTANPYVQIPIVTSMGEVRNVIIVKSAGAVIAIGGGYGTLSEIGHALRNDIPVIGLNTWSLSRNGQPDNSIVPAQNPADAVNKALNMTANQL
ncbi:MAG TPA: TIGR00725 family protein [Dehalococcoidia bacterium]|nr:TIGR00725 family protein [Dehalococcoidia bacterium]